MHSSVRARRVLRARAAGATTAVLAAGVLAVASAPAAASAATTCPGADEGVRATTQATAETAVVCLANAARAAVGQSPLRTNPVLRFVARTHAQDMSDRGYFSHDEPRPLLLGSDPVARATTAGYRYRFLGEDIGFGQRTPRTIVAAWLKSTPHCQNLLNPGFDEVGVGRARTASKWTADFGNRFTPSSKTPYAGCTTGHVPSVAAVSGAGTPAAGPAPAAASTVTGKAAAPGVALSRIEATRTRWSIRLLGGHAVGRRAVVVLYRARRACTDGRCTSLRGGRLGSRHSVRLRTATTVHVARPTGAVWVTVRVPAFTAGGVSYAAVTIDRRYSAS